MLIQDWTSTRITWRSQQDPVLLFPLGALRPNPSPHWTSHSFRRNYPQWVQHRSTNGKTRSPLRYMQRPISMLRRFDTLHRNRNCCYRISNLQWCFNANICFHLAFTFQLFPFDSYFLLHDSCISVLILRQKNYQPQAVYLRLIGVWFQCKRQSKLSLLWLSALVFTFHADFLLVSLLYALLFVNEFVLSIKLSNEQFYWKAPSRK